MAITMRVSVCRKLGDGDYGSYGAEMSVDGVEIPPEATGGELVALRDHWQGVCRAAVDAELARLRGDAPAAAAPAAPAPPRKERHDWPAADHGEAARDRRPPAAARNGSGGGKGGNRTGTPRDGRSLLARLKWLDEEEDRGIFRHVNNWMKSRGNDDRMVDWSPEDVRAGWQEAVRYMEALVNSDSLQGAGY